MSSHRRRRLRTRKLRAFVILMAFLGILAVSAWVYLFVFLGPGNMERQEIYRGVYLTVKDTPGQFGKGKLMIAEVHWDEPGVELYFRPFHPRGSGRMHYTLFPADYLRWKSKLDLMINTTRYYPEEWWKSFPLKQVNSLETLVWEGNVSHIHPLSYMFGWDIEGNFLYEFSKPPSPGFLETLRWGLGVQSISINDGQIRMAALDRNVVHDARTFLGVDPVQKVLWLIVGENISELGMNTIANNQGVIVGGQLDAQDASTMIIGSGAAGVKPLTGIRGRRPLAAVMGIRAEHLPED